jgi:hypothetical protein
MNHTVMLTALLPLATAAATAQATGADVVGATQTAIQKWVETKALISRETRDWALARDSLTASMDVAKREIVATQKKIADAEADIAAADKKRSELLATNEAEKATAATLEQRITALEQRLLQTLPRLPEPLREKLKPLTQLVPAKDARETPPLGNRYATVVGVLNELHKWNREITVTSEVRALPDGTSVEVAVVYVGLGQAFFTGGNGRVAGVGAATADGWAWRQANELAPRVQQVIAMWKNEQPAAFVQLPVQVQ